MCSPREAYNGQFNLATRYHLYAQSNNLALIAEAIDLDKAFNKLSHNFLRHVLRKVSIPQSLLKIIIGMYEGITSQVLVNG